MKHILKVKDFGELVQITQPYRVELVNAKHGVDFNFFFMNIQTGEFFGSYTLEPEDYVYRKGGETWECVTD